ncbi:hypothetical protein Btru_039575 [Bulinus truncatus]|nr:hypothetical protein Btru_039575 [Bulinus truncatus]
MVIQKVERQVEDLHLLTYGSSISIKRLLVNETEDIYLEFETNIQDQYKAVAYIDYGMENGPNRTLCSKTCPDHDNICICESEKKNTRLLNYNSLLVILNLTLSTANDTLQCVWCKNLVHYVVPGCAQEVGLIGRSDTSANVSFHLSEELGRLTGFMSNTLRFQIGLKKLEGVDEFLQMSFLKAVLRYHVAIQFKHLSVFTRYAVSVTSFRGKVEGCTTSFTFTTNKSVPLGPPETKSLDYSRTLKYLWIIWKALSQESKGSDKVIYEVWITSHSNFSLRFNQTSNYFNLTEGIPIEPLTVRLWSLNDVGRSEKFSEILVPLNDVIERPYFIVEFVNKSHAYVILNVSMEVQKVAVRAIVSKQNGSKDPCDDCLLTQRVVVDVQSMNQTQLKLLVPFSKPRRKRFRRKVKYCQYESNCPSDLLENASAVVTQRFQDSDIITQLSDDDITAAGSKIQTRMSSYYTFGKSFSSKTDFSSKILVSLKEKGVFQGMTEAHCYYNRQLSAAKVIACVQDGCLRVNQEQNCAGKQFLIDSFDIYPSQNDRSCNITKTEKYLHLARDDLHAVCDLPQDFKFFCIQANGNTSFITSDPMAFPAVSSDSSPTQTVTIFMTVALVVLLVVGIIVIRVIFICKDRKKKFATLTVLETLQPAQVSIDNPSANIHDNESLADSGISTKATQVYNSERDSFTRVTSSVNAVGRHVDFQHGPNSERIWHSGSETSFNSTVELLAVNSSCNSDFSETSCQNSHYLKQASEDSSSYSSTNGWYRVSLVTQL